MSTGWLVVRAKSGRQNWAAENIAQQGCQHYLPKIMIRRGTLAHAEPLFGPYIFVKPPALTWRFLLNTFGVLGVVLFGESPATIRDVEIDKIRATEVDGMVILPQAPTKTSRWPLGTTIRVKGGVFSGCTGIYEGADAKQRERVLLDFLGRRTSVLLASDMLEAA